MWEISWQALYYKPLKKSRCILLVSAHPNTGGGGDNGDKCLAVNVNVKHS